MLVQKNKYCQDEKQKNIIAVKQLCENFFRK